MKKINFILVFILFAGNLFAAETWDIFNKSVWDVVNADPAVNYQWGTVPVKGSAGITGAEAEAAKTAFKSFITQYPDFVRLQKPALNYSDSYYLNPNADNTTTNTTFQAAVKTGTNYTVELKIQVGAQIEDKTDANEIRARLGGRQLDFFLSYGNGTTGYVGKAKNGQDYGIDPSVPHIYRVEYTAGSSFSYDLYVDDTFAFTEAATSSSGANIMVIGASSKSSGNMDLYYVKMKTAGSPTWDILDKNMDGLTVSKGSSISSGASITKATDAGVDYVNIKKEGNTGEDNAQFYLTTTSNVPDVTATAGNDYINRIGTGIIADGEAYTVEVKARIPSGSTAAGNQIGVRLFNDKLMGIILGNGTVSAATERSTGMEADPGRTANLSTSDWHDYRIVLKADKASYNVYVDGSDTPLFGDVPTISPAGGSGVNLIRLGAESWAECDMDVASVKMGTGDFNSIPKISAVDLSQDSHIAGSEATVTVTARTASIGNGETLLFSLVDEDDTEVVAVVNGAVTDNVATADIVIPAGIAAGAYFVKVYASGQIGDVDVTPKTVPYEIEDNETGISGVISGKSISVSAGLLNAGQALSVKTAADNVSISEVALYGIAGNTVYRKSVSGNEVTFNAPAIAGIYLLAVRLTDGTSETFNILVK
jgi:hypothetical protein